MKIILLDHQNNYIERLSLIVNDNAAKSFNILTTSLSYMLPNTLIQTKLFSDLHVANLRSCVRNI